MKQLTIHFALAVTILSGAEALNLSKVKLIQELTQELSFSCVSVLVKDISSLELNVLQEVTRTYVPTELADQNGLEKVLNRFKTDEESCAHFRKCLSQRSLPIFQQKILNYEKA